MACEIAEIAYYPYMKSFRSCMRASERGGSVDGCDAWRPPFHFQCLPRHGHAANARRDACATRTKA